MRPPIIDYAKQQVAAVLGAGDAALDATVGNGHDTLFLASCVGATGQVYGFDVQAVALEVTRARLQIAGLLPQVQLFHRSHAHLAEVVSRPVRAAMFNLGHLPGGDRDLTTRVETTLPALEAALKLLLPGGLLTVVLYPGHVGGVEEAETVLTWARTLPSSTARVAWYQFLNTRRPAPSLVLVRRWAD